MASPSRSIRAVLIDLSGTLYVDTTPLPACIAALQRLRSAHIPFRICSNTSKESTSSVLAKLHGMGFEIHEDEVFTSLGACRELVRRRGIKRPYLLLSESAMDEFSSMFDDVDPGAEMAYDAVVVGLAPERFTYHHLNTAFRVLANGRHPTAARGRGAPIAFIATHKSRYLEAADGLALGPGGFVAALEYALGGATRAEVVGKPAAPFFRLALESLRRDGVADGDWGDVAVVGDDAEADLGGGAVELGLRRVLVKTGKYREGDEAVRPDELHASFATFVDSLFQ